MKVSLDITIECLKFTLDITKKHKTYTNFFRVFEKVAKYGYVKLVLKAKLKLKRKFKKVTLDITGNHKTYKKKLWT